MITMKSLQTFAMEPDAFFSSVPVKNRARRSSIIRWLLIFTIALTGIAAKGQAARTIGGTDSGTDRAKGLKDSLVAQIQDQVAKVQKDQNSHADVVSDFDGKTAFWKITHQPDGADSLRCIEVSGYNAPNLYQEVYVEKNGLLIYAYSSEVFMPPGQFVQQKWSCSLYFHNSQFIDMRSLGHGKTEDPRWDESEIVNQYLKRSQQLKTFKE